MPEVSEGSLNLTFMSNHLENLCKYLQPTIRLLIPLIENEATAGNAVCISL